MSHIYKTQFRFIRFLGLITIVVFGILSTLGTGGGGGGDGGGVQPLTYSGNTNPAAITLVNAPILVGNVLYGGISSTNIPIPTGASSSASEVQPGSVAAVPNHLLAILHYSLDKLIGTSDNGYGLPAAITVPVDDQISCESGYYTIKGTIYTDDYVTFTGSLSFNYVNCVNEGVTYNGSGTFLINILSPSQLDATMSFALMTISSVEFNGSISGNMQLQASIIGNTETDRMTMNYVAKDNNSSKMYKFENFILTAIIDDIYNLNSSGSITIDDHSYDSVYGYVIVDTPSPLLYSDVNLPYSDNGGVMLFTGDNSSMRLTVMSGRHVRLELDLDGNVGYEAVRYLLWDELAVNTNTDLTDTDGDGMHDSWETTYGLDPNLNDSANDLDLDTFSNLTEYQAGTNPNDAASHP